MADATAVGALSALASALVWGSADFAGGLAARRHRPVQVVALAALAGLAAMGLLAWLRGEHLPTGVDIAWSTAAGLAGSLGIGALYAGLALGNASLVAPTAAVAGAVTPVLAGIVMQGLPETAQLTGMAIGAAGIWLVSGVADGQRNASRRGLGLAVLAGLAFGAFFVLIAQVEHGQIFFPLTIAKLAALVASFLGLVVMRLRLPRPSASPAALAAGVLDAGGNALFLLASQHTRLDIASILASMYPATTVILAGVVLGEKTSRPQWLGIALCLAALALIVA